MVSETRVVGDISCFGSETQVTHLKTEGSKNKGNPRQVAGITHTGAAIVALFVWSVAPAFPPTAYTFMKAKRIVVQ